VVQGVVVQGVVLNEVVQGVVLNVVVEEIVDHFVDELKTGKKLGWSVKKTLSLRPIYISVAGDKNELRLRLQLCIFGFMGCLTTIRNDLL
jgi:hypothetical protein